MEKIDKLIKRIDDEITRNKTKRKELALKNKGKNFLDLREVIQTNIRYLEMFREIAVEIKEED